MYCAVADLTSRFGEVEIAELTDLEDRETVVDSVVNTAIADASEEIDSYLAARYAVPITSGIPAVLTAKAADIARYRLYDDHPTENVRKRYEDAVAWLKLVAMGTVRLPVAAPETTALTSGLDYSVPADDTDNPTFTRLVW